MNGNHTITGIRMLMPKLRVVMMNIILTILFFTLYSFSSFAAYSLTLQSDPSGNNGNGSVKLSWSNQGSDIIYKGYRKSSSESSYSSISLMDYTSIKEIKVLNVYPDCGDGLKSWMDAYGKGIIKVTPVSITNFNRNPSAYLKKSGSSWNYDVVVFGFWDRNNCRDLSYSSYKVVDQFASEGYGVVLGHDTALNHGRNDILERSCGSKKTALEKVNA